MAAHDKWMPFFPGDYLADTVHFTTAEHGAYLLVLMHLWRSKKPIPDDDATFQRITKTTPDEWNIMRTVIIEKLTKQGGGWVQKRLFVELARAEKLHKQRVNGGKTTAKKKSKYKYMSIPAKAQHMQSTSPPDAQHAVTTPFYERGGRDSPPVITTGGSGSLDAPPAPPTAPTGQPKTDTADVEVTMPTGAVVRITSYGSVDEVWTPRDCPQTMLTREQALTLRQKALGIENKPLPVANSPLAAPLPPTATEWTSMARIFVRTENQKWPTHSLTGFPLGPPPGHPGSLCPPKCYEKAKALEMAHTLEHTSAG